MILTVNGSEMPSPSLFEIRYADLGKSSTNAAGHTVMDVLGQKRTLQLGWSYLTADKTNELLSAVRQAHFMVLGFYDPQTAGQSEGTFYVDDVLTPAYKYEGDTPVSYKGVKIIFQER